MRYLQIENRYGPVPLDEVGEPKTLARWKQILLVAGLVIAAVAVIAWN